MLEENTLKYVSGLRDISQMLSISEIQHFIPDYHKQLSFHTKNHTADTSRTVKEVHRVLRNTFNQAVKWKLMARNPVEHATLPKVVFHSLRHSSITYKLKLNGGDASLSFYIVRIYGSVLDFGCGSGHDTKYFRKKGYVGCRWSERAVSVSFRVYRDFCTPRVFRTIRRRGSLRRYPDVFFYSACKKECASGYPSADDPWHDRNAVLRHKDNRIRPGFR